MAAQDTDPTDPHALAVDVQTDLQKLAVLLAHAGAAPAAVAQLTKMAQTIGEVVKVLGAGPGLPPGGAPQGQPEAQQPPGPPQAAPAPQAQPSPQQAVQQHTLHSATHALHAATVAAANARTQGQ